MTAPRPEWRPPHAYLPGRTPRHAEDLFDPFKHDPAVSHTGPGLADSVAWHMGLAFLKDGFFWECHEVLESLWLAAPPNSAERRVLQAVIQLANAALKLRMGQGRAADRLVTISDDLAASAFTGAGSAILGLSPDDFARMRSTALNLAASLRTE